MGEVNTKKLVSRKTEKGKAWLLTATAIVLLLAMVVFAGCFNNPEATFKIYLNDGTDHYYEITGNLEEETALLNQTYLSTYLSEEYKEHYTLLGFAENAEAVAPDYDKMASIALKDKELYAVWKANVYEVKVAGNAALVNGGDFEEKTLQLSYKSQYKVDVSQYSNVYEKNTGAYVKGFNVSVNQEAPVLYTNTQEITIEKGMEFELAFEETENKAVLAFADATDIKNSASQYFGVGTSFTFPNIERTGYVLSGYTKEDLPQVISLDTPIIVEEGVTTYKPFWVGENRSVTWVVNNEQTTSTLKVGEAIFYEGVAPERTSTAEHHFTFKGWNTEDTTFTTGETTSLETLIIAPESNNNTYKLYAVFTAAVREYDVMFNIFNGEETLSETSTLAYGETPVYEGETPARETTDDYIFEFKGWNIYDATMEEDEPIIDIPTVSGEAAYYAVFSKTPNKITVYNENELKIYTQNNDGAHYTDFGEYPKKYVGNKLNVQLEELYNEGNLQEGLTETGKVWLASSTTGMTGAFKEKQNTEYEYKGKRYVRVSAIRYASGNNYKFSDDTLIDATGTIYWFKVEPIKWQIINWSKLPTQMNPEGLNTAAGIELMAKDIIMAGVPFYPNTDGNTSVLWQNSMARAWLNGTSTINIKENGNPDYPGALGGDFTEKGFINEAFSNLEKNKIASTPLVNTANDGTGSNTADGVAGFETTDKIYFLTYYDMINKESAYNNLFGSNASRQKVATDYAKANNAYVHNIEDASKGFGQYWLRSANTTVYVYTVGQVGNGVGNYANRVTQGIVPTLQLSLPAEQ